MINRAYSRELFIITIPSEINRKKASPLYNMVMPRDQSGRSMCVCVCVCQNRWKINRLFVYEEQNWSIATCIFVGEYSLRFVIYLRAENCEGILIESWEFAECLRCTLFGEGLRRIKLDFYRGALSLFAAPNANEPSLTLSSCVCT